MPVKILIPLIVFGLPLTGMSQDGDIRFNHLTIEDGLSQSTVQAIAQDGVGYMWFGTQDGLNMYDGFDFTVYKHSPDDANSISDNDIQVIYEDHQNTLWIGTQSRGLNRFDREKNQFTRFLSDSDDSQTLSSNTVWTLLEDENGNFWVGTAYGLNMMDRESGTFTRILADSDTTGALSNNQINVLFEDEAGNLWIGTENGLNKYNKENQYFEWYLHDPQNSSNSGFQNIRTIHQDSNGILWVGTEESELFYLDRVTDNFKRFKEFAAKENRLSHNSIVDILEDSRGNLWVGTGNGGLELLNQKEETIEQYYFKSDDPNSLNNNFITHIYESRDQILWVGTYGGGINYIEPKSNKFRHYKSEPADSQSLSNNTVRSFHQDKQNNIWIGTDGGGLNKFDPETGLFQRYRHDSDHENSISNDVILDIHETNRGLWLATYGSGVDIFDVENNTVQNIRYEEDNPESLSSDYVFVIHEDTDGNIWLGTNWGGITVLNPDEETFRRFIGDNDHPDDSTTIGNNDIREIYEDSYGDIWIGAYGEVLNRYDKTTDRFSLYDIDVDLEFFASVVQCIYEDERKRLWMATRGAGLMRYQREKDQLITYTTREGLPSNTIHAIVEDDNGNLWLSTNNGISKFNPDNNEFKNYRLQDGLQSREFSPRASLKDVDGYIYFGGVNGFNRFHPERVQGDSLIPPVVINEFLLFNKPVPINDESVLKKDIEMTDRLILDHSMSVLTFGFSVLNFSSQKGNEYAYRLEGFEEEWNYVGEQKRATYTNLNPGEYTFQVKASNSDGVWGDTGASVSLVITPPFWKTGWFIGLMILGFAGLIFLIHRLRFRAIKRTNKRLELLVSGRTEELKASNATKNKLFSIIAHDLNNVAAGLVGLTDLLQQSVEREDFKDIKEYSGYLQQATGQFVTMLRNLLQWSRAQTGKITFKPQQFKLGKLATEILDQEGMVALNKEIALISNIDPELEVYADPDMISVVLRNLVNNALKFTGKGGEVEVRARLKGDKAEVSVSDNGVGMNRETIGKIFSTEEQISTRGTSNEKGTGLGLSLCKDFIHKNGGKLQVKSKAGEGTTITFMLDVDKQDEDSKCHQGSLEAAAV